MHRGAAGLCDRLVDRHPGFKQQRRIAHQYDLAVDGRLDAACLQLFKSLWLRYLNASARRTLENSFGQRMRRASVCRSRKAQKIVLIEGRVKGLNLYDLRLIRGQRAGLIKDHRVGLRQQLQIEAALDQNAAPRGAGDCGNHDERCRQAKLCRRCEDQQRHHLRDIARDEEYADQKDQNDRDQPARHLVRQLLYWCSFGLGALDQGNDAGKDRVAADPIRAHVDRTGFDDCSGEDLRALGFVLGHAFASDRRLIHCSAAADHHAVNRNLLAGTHENDLPGLDRGDGHCALRAILADQCRLRHSADQFLDGCPRAISVQLGDELGNEDDDHQHSAGNRFAAEHRDERCNRDEDFGTDFSFGEQINQPGLD